jgi:hypothetical protein
MKKFKLLALALLIGTAGLFAAELESPDVPKKEIRNQIVQLLKTPRFAVPNDIHVTITFTFSSEGELVVLHVDSKDPDVLKYVRKSLNYKKMQNPGERDKLYTMPLTLTSA